MLGTKLKFRTYVSNIMKLLVNILHRHSKVRHYIPWYSMMTFYICKYYY